MKVVVAGTGYVGLSIATLLSQNHEVMAVDIVPEKVEKINKRISPIRDEYIEKYLKENQLEQVIVGGENYDGARPCDFEWVKSLQQECVKYNVKFCFIETGTKFIKDGKTYMLKNKELQAKMAYKSKMNFEGKKIQWKLYDEFLNPLESIYQPFFGDKCEECGSKPICNGCSKCGKCKI